MDAVAMESVLIRVASKIFFKFVKNDYKLLLISFKHFCLSIIDWEMSFFFRCNMGYSGQKCEYSTVTIPSYLSEMFQTSNMKELPNVLKVT